MPPEDVTRRNRHSSVRSPMRSSSWLFPAAFIAATAVALVSPATAAPPWSEADYPNPMTDVLACGRRGVSSRICDPDQVIPYESANVVESYLKDIADGTEVCTQNLRVDARAHSFRTWLPQKGEIGERGSTSLKCRLGAAAALLLLRVASLCAGCRVQIGELDLTPRPRSPSSRGTAQVS